MVVWGAWRSQKARILVLTIVAVAVLALPAVSLEPWRMVVRVQGRVESQRSGEQAWDPIFRSRVLSDGDSARTQDNSRAMIKLADGSQFTVGAATVVEMTRFVLTPEGRTVVFNQRLGRVRATVAKSFGSEGTFEVKTPNGVLAAHGTEFYVEYVGGAPPSASSRSGGADSLLAMGDGPVADGGGAPGGSTNVIVYDGIVEVTSGRRHHRFYPGDYGTIRPDGRIFVNPAMFPLFARGSGPDADLHPGPHGPALGGRPPVDFMRPGHNTGVSTGTYGDPPLMPGDVQNRVLQSTGNVPQGGTVRPTGTIQIQIR